MIIYKRFIIYVILAFSLVSVSYGQELTCEERYFDINFTYQQNFFSINNEGDIKEFLELFTKEYFLVNLSAVDCEDCLNESEAINRDNEFQKYFGMSGSCDFGTFVDYGSLAQRIDVTGSGLFVADHSYEFTGMNTYYFPQLFDSPVADELPTFLLIGRDGEIVRRYTGELPRYLISDYCVEVDQCLLDTEDDIEEDDDAGDEDQDTNGDNTNGGDDQNNNTNGDDTNSSNNGGDGEPGSEPPGGGQPGSGPGGGEQPGDGGGGGGISVDPVETITPNLEQDPGRLQIEIPWEAERDVITGPSQLTTSNSYNALRITRRQINRRLWIFFGASILAAILYAGFKFITAAGDPEKSKAALKTFIYIGAAFAIALFAFIIVRLITNLFIS